MDHNTNEEQYQEENSLGSFVYFVNPMQYNRIISRRIAKEKMIKDGRWPDKRQRIMHISRSRHSICRTRTADGKFAGGSSGSEQAGPVPNQESPNKPTVNEPEKQPLKEARWVPIVPGHRSPEYSQLPCGFFVKLDPSHNGQVEVVVEPDGSIFVRPAEDPTNQS
ncbi:unnamed protein product [Auanema sp. JU1783]|nr:unnamed protein product [Auanema sp. JU1783]